MEENDLDNIELEEDLETFKEEDFVILGKKGTIVLCGLLALAGISIGVRLYVNSLERYEYKVTDTGKYAEINNGNVSYIENENDSNDEQRLTEQINYVCSSISSLCCGRKYSGSMEVNGYTEGYLKDLEKTMLNDDNAEICLTDIFGDIDPSFGGGEISYEVYNWADDGTITYRGWVTSETRPSEGVTLVNYKDLPDEVKKQYGNKVIGYCEVVMHLSETMGADVYEKEGKYYIQLKDLVIIEDEGKNLGSVMYYNHENVVELDTLEPSKTLRRMNLNSRFGYTLSSVDKESKNRYVATFTHDSEDRTASVVFEIDDYEIKRITMSDFE